MPAPRTSRKSLPTPGALSLSTPTALSDLEDVGWWNDDSIDLLWALSGAGDPNLCLNQLVRLKAALREQWGQLDGALRTAIPMRVRLIALLGASSVLGDHLVANPQLWRSLEEDLPTAQDMQEQMLACVGAERVSSQTYRASVKGAAAEAALRTTYRSLLLRIAALDVAGTYGENARRHGQPEVPFEQVTACLTDLADAALTAALSVAVYAVYGEEEPSAKLAVIAMGKCGARELNYISDVDVVFVAEPVDAKITRVATEFIRIGCRCFFEVDAALRPEGKRGALVRTLESHVAYYKKWAHTWEFQALLKHRPMAGDMELGAAYSAALSPMVWEASQRESFVEDVQAMRRRVVANVPHNLKSRELKLGEGGLRDVEFAVQLLQLVHGRYDDTLHTLATVDAIGALVVSGYVGRETGAQLLEGYKFLRLLEHRLQLHKIKRTHTLPGEDDYEAWRWMARSAGFYGKGALSSVAECMEQLRIKRRGIATMHNQLFYRPLLESVVGIDADAMKLSPEAAKNQLAALGYRHPDRAFEHLTALAAGGSRKAKIQAMLLPTLMEWLSDSADPDAGLLNYRKLSDAAYAKTWFLRMLRDEGIVGKRLMTILGNSPYVAELFITTPDVVKMLGDGAGGPKLLTAAPVTTSLIRAASRHKDPEKAIAVARSLRRTELARIAAADLLGLMDVQSVCLHLSYVWDAVLEAALRAEIAATEAKATIAVIGMGRLGGAELGYGSDADVMFVCEPLDGVEENEAVRWAIGICDRMRQRLAKPSGDPPLDVDLGLRPEGRSGAVVRTLDSYRQYYHRWGETWEIQALLRAAWIAGDQDLGERFIAMIDEIRYPAGGVGEKTMKEVRRMKARVDNERLPRGADRHTHTKLGRGGLTDIEWTVQLLTLMHAHTHPGLKNPSTLKVLDVIEETGLLPVEKVEVLRHAWLFATNARNAIVLVRGKRMDQIPQPGPQLAQVAGAAGWPPGDSQGFLEEYLRLTRRAHKVVDEVFWGEVVSEHDEL